MTKFPYSVLFVTLTAHDSDIMFTVVVMGVIITIIHDDDDDDSSVGATARCGLWPVEQYLSIFPFLSPTVSIFSLPTPEDLFLLLLSILSWVFLFVSSLPVLE